MSNKSSVTDPKELNVRRLARLHYLNGNSMLHKTPAHRACRRSKYDPQQCDAARGYRQ